MKRAYGLFASVFGFAIVALYAYNGYQTDDYSASSFLQWLESFITRAELKLTDFTSADAPNIAANLIAGQEGFRAKTYTDRTGNPTIGYGHKLVGGDGFDVNSMITESEARALLVNDIQTFVNCVESAVKAALTPNQEAALISLAYNIGCGAFQNSTLVKALNNGDYQGASDQFGVWVYGKVNGAETVIQGLVSRRSAEQSVFNS